MSTVLRDEENCLNCINVTTRHIYTMLYSIYFDIQLKLPVKVYSVSLDCRRTTDYSEETHTDTRRTCGLHAWGPKSSPFLL